MCIRGFTSQGLCVQETRCFDAVVELYAGLGEEDVLAGLWKRKGAAEETRNALAAIQQGFLPRAQHILTSAMHKQDAGGYAAPSASPFSSNPSRKAIKCGIPNGSC